MPENQTPERGPAGAVWLDLVRKFTDAHRDGDEARAAALHPLIQGLEVEYPAQVQAEKDFWR